MNAVGLITEYNPFHNGHLHHLRESCRLSGADVAVAVMSGHFLQRGEAALVDKWVRTEMALAAGVDVVVELPFAWACASAPHFALGAVQCLDALGRVGTLCFGSEKGELEPLACCAARIDASEDDERTAVRRRGGLSYPAARARALAEEPEGEEAAALLGSPNNILGIAYLRALRRTGSGMRPVTVRRVGAGYHDVEAAEGIASATGIRRMLSEGQDPTPWLPPPVADILRKALERGADADPDRLLPLLLTRLFGDPDEVRRVHPAADGLDRRLREAADRAGTWQSLVDGVKARHLTRTRVQRLLIHLLNGFAADDVAAFAESGPLYLHLLGLSARGRVFLAACRKELRIPLVSNYSRIHALLRRRYGAGSALHALALRQLDLELRATRNYTLLMRRWDGRDRSRDFFEPLRER